MDPFSRSDAKQVFLSHQYIHSLGNLFYKNENELVWCGSAVDFEHLFPIRCHNINRLSATFAATFPHT